LVTSGIGKAILKLISIRMSVMIVMMMALDRILIQAAWFDYRESTQLKCQLSEKPSFLVQISRDALVQVILRY
jgi:hypothetical protein